MTPPNTPLDGAPPDPEDDPGGYVGLPVRQAAERARERGWRTVRALPADAVITLEYVAGRLNFAVRDGRVTRCWQG